jgi:FlaG/FlaF family flagellin (archaellin)
VEKFRENKDAVSPVVGVILLVGLTVIMISIIAVSVYSFSIPESAPQARIVVVEAKGGIGSTVLYKNFIVLKHKGGDALNENNTRIIITGKGYAYTGTDPQLSSAQDMRVTYRDLTGENDIYGGDDEEIVEGTSWNAGEQIELYGRDGNTGDNTVDSKWKLQKDSTVLVTIIDTTTNEVIAVSQAKVKKA